MDNILATYSPKLVPVWSTQNMSEVSRLLIDPDTNQTVSYEDLSDGTQISDCKLPCTQTYVTTRVISYNSNAKDVLDSISLTFVDSMEIMSHNFPGFQLVAFLSQVNPQCPATCPLF